MDREKQIVKVSIQGIIVNLILVAFKATVGVVANSIAIILDAVNNLSDALAQVITIAGTKLSQKAPDKEHPYGYGRVEYLSSAVVAAIVLCAGITSLKESLEKTIHPSAATYSKVSLLIIAVAVVVKFVFGRYVKAQGEKVQSQALVAAGTDAAMDSVLSLSTLIAAIVSSVSDWQLEGILGVILSIFIIKAGVEILKETLGSIIGDRSDKDFTMLLKKQISSYAGVKGAYDLILHDYGPSRSIGSVHIEVDADMTAEEIQHISRRIIADIYHEHGVILTVGIYAVNEQNVEIQEKKEFVNEFIKTKEHILQMHGFYVDEETKNIAFDLVISYHAESAPALVEEVKQEVMKKYPGYICDINIDHDFSD